MSIDRYPDVNLSSEELARVFGLLACLYADQARDIFNDKRVIQEPLFDMQEGDWVTDHDFTD